MKKSKSAGIHALGSNVQPNPLLCRIHQIESRVGAKDLIVTCEIREGDFFELVDLMFLEEDTVSLKEFFEAHQIWIRVNEKLSPGEPVGILRMEIADSPAMACRSTKKRS